MKILVAVDDSHFSEAALNMVLDRPWPAGSEVKILSVVEPFHPESAGWATNQAAVAAEAQQELVDGAHALVKKAEAKLVGTFGADKVTSEVREGHIKDQILEVAILWPADLIVVGSHGRKGFTKFLLGSVSEAIISQAPCSVEVVKLPQEPKSEE